jgi:tetraacyldisaccharide 4'-kinase
MTRFKAPRFWSRSRPGLRARLLQPGGWLYGRAVAWHRATTRPVRLPLPVVSIGNITLGGTGKTPLVIALARELAERGWRPAVISRGYGSGRREPLRVVPGHGVAAVGDEPLEMAAALADHGLAVWVGSERVAAGRRALEAGADLLLLDDGLQHWRLARDCDVTVLDARQRLGNGLTFPAGPLREPAAALARAQLLVLSGNATSTATSTVTSTATANDPAGLPWPAGRPWLTLPTRLELPPALLAQPLLAFCGIGLPAKFFDALRQEGCRLVACEEFPDHHPYARGDLERLLALAQAKENATLVTTVKDWQRLTPLLRDVTAQRIRAVPLRLERPAVARLADLVQEVLAERGWVRPPEGRPHPPEGRPHG